MAGKVAGGAAGRKGKARDVSVGVVDVVDAGRDKAEQSLAKEKAKVSGREYQGRQGFIADLARRYIYRRIRRLRWNTRRG